MSETDFTKELGPVIASYGWSIESRALAILVSLSSFAVGLGWLAWDMTEYGDVSPGGLIITGLGVGVGVLALAIGLSTVGKSALVLHDQGFVSYIHPKDAVCLYREIRLIQRIVKGHYDAIPHLFLLQLKNGSTIRIHAVRNMRGAIREIQGRSGAPVEDPGLFRLR